MKEAKSLWRLETEFSDVSQAGHWLLLLTVWQLEKFPQHPQDFRKFPQS